LSDLGAEMSTESVVHPESRPREAGRESPFERSDVRRQLIRVEQRMLDEYAGIVDAETVQSCVREAEHALGHARLHHFVPVLVERDARRRIGARAPGE
jgi:hypothetical protein